MPKRKKRQHRKPIIGITCEVQKLKRFYSDFELVCNYAYIRAIVRAGGLPVLLPMNHFDRDNRKLMDHIDGLVIIGGADIPPIFYGEKQSEKVAPMCRGRIYFDMALYQFAQKKKIPVLAICYGMQLLNVIYGGKLHQDIKSEVKGAHPHQGKRAVKHKVHIQEGTLCHRIFRHKSFMVISDHHQAVKIPGKSLRVTAYAEDGVAEA